MRGGGRGRWLGCEIVGEMITIPSLTEMVGETFIEVREVIDRWAVAFAKGLMSPQYSSR